MKRYSLLLSFMFLVLNTYAVEIAPKVELIRGAVNGVILHGESKTAAIYGAPEENVNTDVVFVTHHRRDVVWAAEGLVDRGAKLYVPQEEMSNFQERGKFWDEFVREKRFHDSRQQTTKVLVRSFPQAQGVKDGDAFEIEPFTLRVISTSGYTRGSVSYAFEAGGKKIICTGDLIQDGGKILDLYSLQDATNETEPGTGVYHGFMVRAAQLIDSLRCIAEENPDLLIPARGAIIDNPQEAIEKLIERIQAVYENYLTTCALRWYWGDDYVRSCAERILGKHDIDWMPMAKTRAENYEWVVPIGNTRVIRSMNGAGLVIDCGSKGIMDSIAKMLDEGTLKRIEGLYITHYHADHTDHAAAFASEYQLPVYSSENLRDILEHPGSYHLPVVTDNAIERVQSMPHGSSMRWYEFRLTFYNHPGQTIYHGGLLVEHDNGESVFLCGDSFTPSGMDDYCMLNRNWLHDGTGYFKCLEQVRSLPEGTWLINQHVNEPFQFTKKQIDFMEKSLRERKEILSSLFPWDDLHFGIDEQWARFYPYGIEANTGENITLWLIIKNHCGEKNSYHVKFNIPENWKIFSQETSITLLPHQKGRVPICLEIPDNEIRQTAVITADISWNDWEMKKWCEAVIFVGN